MIYKYPVFENKFIKRLLKFLAFIMCWAILASIFNVLLPPKKIPADSRFFNICTLENNQPKILHFQDFTNQPLCTQEYSQTREDNPAFSFHLKQKGDEWELAENSDSLADPIVYHYQIKGNQVIPMWYSMGGFTNSIMNWFWAFLVALIGFAIFKDIKRLRTRKN